MEYTAEMNIYSKFVEKLPQDFINQHPKTILSCALLIVFEPDIRRGGKYLAQKVESNFRYWVDAKYGKPATIVLESSEPLLIGESTAA